MPYTRKCPVTAPSLLNVPMFEISIVLLVFSGKLKAVIPISLLPFDFTFATFILSVVLLFGRVSPTYRLPKESVCALALFFPIVLFAMISIAWSPQGSYSMSKAFYFCSLGAFVFCTPFFLGRLHLQTVIKTTFYLSILYALLYFYTKNLFNAEFDINYLSSSRFIATGACVGISLTTLGILSGELGKSSVLALGTAFLTIATLTTGGRAPLIGLLLVATLNLLYLGTRLLSGSPTVKQISFLFLLSIAITTIIASLRFHSIFDYQTLNRISIFFTSPDMGDSASARLTLIRMSLESINSNPILGTGSGGLGDGNDRIYSHNILLEILAEYGIIAFVAFCLLLAYSLAALATAFRRRRPLAVTLPLLSIFLFNLLNAMTSGDINDNRALFFSLSLSIAVATIRATSQKSNRVWTRTGTLFT